MTGESVKNTVSLMLITIVAGLLLGLIYEITKEPIATQQQNAKEQAYKEVFADADTFEEIKVDIEKMDEELKKQGIDATIEEAMKALKKDGSHEGYVLTVTDHEGYGGDIRFAIGIKSDGTINGISFLSISETAGLGMTALEDDFKNQFAGKKAQHFAYTKSGASADNEIDALSGATITTNAVTNGVNPSPIPIPSNMDKHTLFLDA